MEERTRVPIYNHKRIDWAVDPVGPMLVQGTQSPFSNTSEKKRWTRGTT